jgi:hypothetical protein
MIGKLAPLEMNEDHCLWFEIPADMQGLVVEYLSNVIKAYDGERIKKKFRAMISTRSLNTDEYTPPIPVRFGNETVHFYCNCRCWRVGATHKFLTIAQLAIKEEILLDINAILETA